MNFRGQDLKQQVQQQQPRMLESMNLSAIDFDNTILPMMEGEDL